jgi:hypothetical protein
VPLYGRVWLDDDETIFPGAMEFLEANSEKFVEPSNFWLGLFSLVNSELLSQGQVLQLKPKNNFY